MSGFIINPYGFGGSSTPFNGVGFSARKTTGSGADNTVIAGWSEDWDSASEFNATTGVWSPSSTGYAWIAGGGFPSGGTPGGTLFASPLKQNTTTRAASVSYDDSEGHGDHCHAAAFVDITASDTFDLVQGDDTAERCWFSGFVIDTTAGFHATLTGPSSASPLTGYTETFDVGGDFNPTTGVFTAPADGLHLVYFVNRENTTNDFEHGHDIRVNGTAVHSLRTGDPGANFTTGVGSAVLLNLNASDTVDITMYYAGASRNTRDVYWSMALVNPTHYFAATKTSASGTTNSTIDGLTESFDSGAVFTPSTGIFTAPADGQYYFMGHGRVSRGSGEGGVRLYVNGSDYARARHYQQSSSHNCHACLSVVVNLSEGDTVNLHQAGGTAALVSFAGISIDVN